METFQPALNEELVSKKKNMYLLLCRIVVVISSFFIILSFISSIKTYYDKLRLECVLQSCGPFGPPAASIEALTGAGLTSELYALAFVLNDSVLAFLFYAAASIILWKSKRDLLGYLAVFGLVTYGTTFSTLLYLSSDGNPWMERWTEGVAGAGRLALFLFLLLFPNGRFVPSRCYLAFIPFFIIQIMNFLLPGTIFDLSNWPDHARIAYYGSMIGVIIYSQIYRFRKISTSEQRQQTKWVVYGVTLSFLGFIATSGFFVYSSNPSPVTYILLSVLLHLFVSIIPVTLSFAVLRHRLWDIDPLVNRMILYGALSLSIVLLYSISVLYLSNVFQTRGNFIISLIATSIVAVLFGPIKEHLQRILNRFMMGKHDDPYSVLAELGSRFSKPIAPDEMLRAVAETIRNALRLPYAGISLGVNGKEKLTASTGETKYDMYTFPIVHGGEELGTLLLSGRSPEEAFTTEDRKLLDVMLQQAGQIVQNAKMVLDMKLMALDLQASREKLVLAREEERRTIRMNLHDDLAPRLLSLAFNVAAAEQYIKKSPDTAIELLEELRSEIRSTVDDIRKMVHGLRPPTLDEFGLLGSIQSRMNEIAKTSEQAVMTLDHTPLQLRLHAPNELPVLPAAVEVAAYRIVTESLVNIIRHAKATRCDVYLRVNAGCELQIEVLDDGIGLPPRIKPSGHGGIGLASIRERAAELGGECSFENLKTGGTRVKAVLPFSQEEEIS